MKLIRVHFPQTVVYPTALPCRRELYSPLGPEYSSPNAVCEKPLKKWNLDLASPSGDYLTFLCLLLLFLIVNPLILQNTFWSYKILVSFSTIF